MTNNVFPLHFATSQASSSQNSNVDDTLEGYKVKSALTYKIFSTLSWWSEFQSCQRSFKRPLILFQIRSLLNIMIQVVLLYNILNN